MQNQHINTQLFVLSQEKKDPDKMVDNHNLFIQGKSAEFCATKLIYRSLTPLVLNYHGAGFNQCKST